MSVHRQAIIAPTDGDDANELALSGVYQDGSTATSYTDCMLYCLKATGTKCLSFSHNKKDNTCEFSSKAAPKTIRSFYGSFYAINSFKFPAAGVTVPEGSCGWLAASETDW
jgi:hypothetical protein